jgi:hypothetical protein
VTKLLKALSIVFSIESLNTNNEVRIKWRLIINKKKYEKSVLRYWYLVGYNVSGLLDFLFSLQFGSTSYEEPNDQRYTYGSSKVPPVFYSMKHVYHLPSFGLVWILISDVRDIGKLQRLLE